MNTPDKHLEITITGGTGSGKSAVGRLIRDTLAGMGFQTTLADDLDEYETEWGDVAGDWRMDDARYDATLTALSGELRCDVRTAHSRQPPRRRLSAGNRTVFILEETPAIPYPDGLSLWDDCVELGKHWYKKNIIEYTSIGTFECQRIESYARARGWDGSAPILIRMT